ncbi:MAG TPA: RHS repeat-associated core domain-containing protein, partial [Anaerolineae bacterium]|nr:RHS repeat-associated core domain-containing protein [Anaerolineae bacterium]
MAVETAKSTGWITVTNTTDDESAPAGVADEWLWAFGTGLTSTLASPVYTYTLPGIYTVTQWITDTATGATDALTRSSYITVTGESSPSVVTTTITYDYDPLYRLVSAIYSSGEVYTYTYDSVGNRLKKGVDGAVTDYVYDDANRLTSAGGVEYTWDGNGNLLDDGVRTYEYDHANRLIEVVSSTFTTTFVYNGDGHRVTKSENGVTTTYVVAILGLSQVLVETTGGQTTWYVYGHDLIAEYDGSAWAWHLNDGLGSVRHLADAAGDVSLAQGYTPFGVPLWSQGSGVTGYGFTGERWEAYAQLLFLRARYYEPGTGRFSAKDPIIRNHPYLYGGGNPIRFIDPTGLEYFPAVDVYSCDHQGGPDPRDPYQYRLILGDSVSDYYFSVGTPGASGWGGD